MLILSCLRGFTSWKTQLKIRDFTILMIVEIYLHILNDGHYCRFSLVSENVVLLSVNWWPETQNCKKLSAKYQSQVSGLTDDAKLNGNGNLCLVSKLMNKSKYLWLEYLLIRNIVGGRLLNFIFLILWIFHRQVPSFYLQNSTGRLFWDETN